MNLFDSGSIYNIPFKDDSDGVADTTTDSDTALNLAQSKIGWEWWNIWWWNNFDWNIFLTRYEAPCSPNCSCESDGLPSSSPKSHSSCSKERHSSSPGDHLGEKEIRRLSAGDKDREASTSPTTSAIKTVQSILATLQASQHTLCNLISSTTYLCLPLPSSLDCHGRGCYPQSQYY